jgi:hypothetical protein
MATTATIITDKKFGGAKFSDYCEPESLANLKVENIPVNRQFTITQNRALESAEIPMVVNDTTFSVRMKDLKQASATLFAALTSTKGSDLGVWEFNKGNTSFTAKVNISNPPADALNEAMYVDVALKVTRIS